jgi:hypothetical protein
MNINEPPGIIHPLFKENYAWVDQCLREKYYNNFNNLFLSNKYDDYDLVVENSISLLKPTPITWANYKSNAILKCIEDDEEDNELCINYKNRKRTESDISNYELNVGKVILNAYSNSLLEDNFNLNFDYFEDVSTTNSSYSEESYYSYDSY